MNQEIVQDPTKGEINQDKQGPTISPVRNQGTIQDLTEEGPPETKM